MAKVQQFTDDSPVPTGSKAVILFGADWHEACLSGGAMDQVLTALASTTPSDIIFGRVAAEDCPGLTGKYSVTAVPTFVLLNETGNVVETVVGGDDTAKVTTAVQRLMNSTEAQSADATYKEIQNEEPLSTRLDRLIRSSDIMVFMKGTPVAPRCGFSRQVVELLEAEQIPFGSFDILADEAVRQGLKKHSNWPTYPQVYCKGELIGGLDIIKEMREDGPLKDQLGITTSTTAPTSLDDRLKELTNRSKVMLFMKGLPSAPKCGFSRKMVEILNEEGVSFDSFDILTDEVRLQIFNHLF